MIGADEIALMKDGARIINVARGVMIDHNALGDALKSGKLGGAALDVFPEEPLTADSPIYDFPNTIITPHTGASARLYAKRAAEIFRRNREAFTSGGQMINVFDRGRAY
jgi:phosphoglycerate dehydrogenase-like enzyme